MTAQLPIGFEPLASANPVPGDSYEVAVLARRLSDTAEEIATQTANLRKLASNSSEFWTGKAAAEFHDSASGLADRIQKAQHRYETAGQVLRDWAPQIDTAQAAVYAAVKDVQEAQQALRDNAPAAALPAGAPPLTPDQETAARQRAAACGDASTIIAQATSRFHDAVDAYNTAAGRSADAIEAAYSHDGLKDSWWDRNFHWISAAMKIIAIIVIVLAIITIFIACPWAVGLLAVMGMSVEGATAAVATATMVGIAASLILDTMAAETGKQSWTAAILDVLAAATFGFGKLAELGVGALAKYGEDIAEAVAAGRAGRATMAAHGLPRLTYSAARVSQTLRSLLTLSPRVSRALDAADQAAAKASADVAASLDGVEGSRFVAMAAQSPGIAKDLAKLLELSASLPGVVRLALSRAVASAVTATDAAAQSTTLVGTTGYNVTGDVKEWIEERDFEARLDDILHQYSSPLVHVP